MGDVLPDPVVSRATNLKSISTSGKTIRAVIAALEALVRNLGGDEGEVFITYSESENSYTFKVEQ